MDASQFRTVDWVADAEDQNRTRLLRSQDVWTWRHFATAASSWAMLAGCGAVVGLIAVLLTLATGWLADIREGHCRGWWYLSEATCCLGHTGKCAAWVEHSTFFGYVIYVVLSVTFAVAATVLVSSLAPFAAGSGISEIKCIIQGFNAPPFLSGLTLAVKCVALPLTIASGLSVGKEGPSVHYAACVGHVVSSKAVSSRLLAGRQDHRKRSDLLTACCAAGVAVAFGSPIGGLLFGLEEMAAELSLHTVWRTYFCCLVATSVVSMLNPFRTGQLVLFSVRYDSLWHSFDLPFFVLLGVFGGIAGHFITKTNLRITALRKRFWGVHAIPESLVLSLVTAAICYFNGYLRVDMTKSMQILFHECDHGGETHASCDADGRPGLLISLAIACVLRTALLLVTYGAAKVPAGIFVPSLAIGALFGRFVGTVVWMLRDKFPESTYFAACSADAASFCVNPGAYALLGAGALLAGVMHITLTVVIVMFELTGALHYIVPTMIVVGVTRLISSQLGHNDPLGGGGIADRAIRANNYPFLERDTDELDFHGATAATIMVPAASCSTVREGSALPRAAQKFRTYPVVNDENQLVAATSGSKVDKSPLVVAPTDHLEPVYALFAQLGPHTVYVTDKGVFKGLITRKDMGRTHRVEPPEFSDLEVRIGTSVKNLLSSINDRLGAVIGLALPRR